MAVNLEKFYAIAKPRDEKAHRKFVNRYRFRKIITLWQNIILSYYSFLRRVKNMGM